MSPNRVSRSISGSQSCARFEELHRYSVWLEMDGYVRGKPLLAGQHKRNLSPMDCTANRRDEVSLLLGSSLRLIVPSLVVQHVDENVRSSMEVFARDRVAETSVNSACPSPASAYMYRPFLQVLAVVVVIIIRHGEGHSQGIGLGSRAPVIPCCSSLDGAQLAWSPVCTSNAPLRPYARYLSFLAFRTRILLSSSCALTTVTALAFGIGLVQRGATSDIPP